MEIKIWFDYHEILMSRTGNFAVNYFAYCQSKKSKQIPKKFEDKLGYYIYNLLGKLATLYLDFYSYLYFKSLTEKEYENWLVEALKQTKNSKD